VLATNTGMAELESAVEARTRELSEATERAAGLEKKVWPRNWWCALHEQVPGQLHGQVIFFVRLLTRLEKEVARMHACWVIAEVSKIALLYPPKL